MNTTNTKNPIHSTNPTNSINQRIRFKLIILIILLLIPSFFVFSQSEPEVVKKKGKLKEVLSNIDGFKVVETSTLEDDVYAFLDLDDYIFTTYEKDGIKITLYIGFYYTSDKVSAAHSPLVCFPGQGWTVTEPIYETQMVGEYPINFAQINATQGGHEEIVIYWYQSGDNTTSKVFHNKLNNFLNKVFKNDQQHAFVRISVPLPFKRAFDEKITQTIYDFNTYFFPEFLSFIDSE